MKDIDKELEKILLEHIVLATDNGQPYIKYTDTAVEAIKQLINQAYKKGYIDGAIAEAKSLTDFLKKRGNK